MNNRDKTLRSFPSVTWSRVVTYVNIYEGARMVISGVYPFVHGPRGPRHLCKSAESLAWLTWPTWPTEIMGGRMRMQAGAGAGAHTSLWRRRWAMWATLNELIEFLYIYIWKTGPKRPKLHVVHRGPLSKNQSGPHLKKWATGAR